MNIELIRVDEKAKAEDPFLAVQRQLQANIQYIDRAYSRINQIHYDTSEILSKYGLPGYNYQVPRCSSISTPRGYTPSWFIYDEIDDGEPNYPAYGFWQSLVLDLKDMFKRRFG